MCGRFTLTLEISELQLAFNLGAQTVNWQAQYNIAPSHAVPVITQQKPGMIQLFRWGLIPSWANDPGIGYKLINARSETIQEKPSFRSAFQSRRCLILADGFYEWQTTKSGKRPFYFQQPNREPFYFAGLWDAWMAGGQVPILSCTILTTNPNSVIAPIHDRMPVILNKEEGKSWLIPDLSAERLMSLLRPAADSRLMSHPVSTKVNSPSYQGADCNQPVSLDS